MGLLGFFLHWLKALLIKHNPVPQEKVDFGLSLMSALKAGILKHSIGYDVGMDLPQEAASVATVTVRTVLSVLHIHDKVFNVTDSLVKF